MRMKKRSGVRLISAGVACLAAFGLAMGSSQAASFALSYLGRAFNPGEATCFSSADFGRTSNNGNCGSGGIWYVMNPPVISTGQRLVSVTATTGFVPGSTVNAVVANRLGQIIRQTGTRGLPGGVGGPPPPTILQSTLTINADEYLEFDFFLMPTGSVMSVVY